MDENLIGYLLNALDDPDRRQVEAYLRSHPDCQGRLETLRRALAPLAVGSTPAAPPPGLALRTLARVAEVRAQPRAPHRGGATAPLPPAPPTRRGSGSWLSPRRADVLAAAVLLILLGGLTGPWLLQQWARHGRVVCANNLRAYGQALTAYADNHHEELPRVGEEGPRGYAGSFVPMLRDPGYLTLAQHLACDPSGQRAGPPPSTEEVERARLSPDQRLFQQRARQLAGNYAYSLGYREGGALHGLRSACNQPILADHRPEGTVGPNSPNHGGYGQNVLYTDGDVRWCTTPGAGCEGDNIYLNRKGDVRAGVDLDDTILGAGETGPGR